MNTKDRKSLFCSEVIQWAFQDLAGGKEDFPRFPTSFRNFQHHPFLQEMGVKVSETFAPADIELDPNFQVVMEFRRVQELRTTRMLDSVAESI